ncbi:hypothetical protein FO519_003398 [Halicephalobus sp. NKZ332]|nr:hypothetical protein FO519_003398 [Halicephalobus sp. NKZ332]
MLVLISILLSKHPARCVIALIVLKWPTGKTALNWCMDKAVGFLSNTQNGTRFVYGFVANPPSIEGMDAPFAYTSLPVITFFGALCSLLYFYGIIQWILIHLATVLQYTMGTTAAESLNAMASIFLGPTEAAVLIQTSTKTMTQSEIIATMTAGFAMISGSLFAIYISFGACPVYLIAANAMSAPAVLAVSKLIYPEVQISLQKEMKSFRFPPCTESSALESLSTGATQTIRVIAAIIVNLIVYVALITMANTCLSWMGALVGHPEVDFNKLMSWIFYPFAYMLGVTKNHQETMNVAKLIGLKTVLNEFFAYQTMATMLVNKELSARAQMIAIFALCGYSNFSQIGSQIGIFQALSPLRKKSFVKGAGRSMVAGEIACFMTACIVGAIVNNATNCMPSNSS